jgi:hypothetical protein
VTRGLEPELAIRSTRVRARNRGRIALVCVAPGCSAAIAIPRDPCIPELAVTMLGACPAHESGTFGQGGERYYDALGSEVCS